MIGVGTYKVSEKAKRYVNEVLTSERISYGPFTQKFERLFAASHDCRFAVMTNSGTSSLLIALAALKNKYGWKDGDEVIVPAVTFIASSNVVMQLSLKPVFVDVDPIHYALDPDKIEAAITPRTRCIMPVHLFGSPCDMQKISAIAQKHHLRMVEDSCETMFVKHHGKSVGSFGDIACFSTYVAHILTTGVGGLCTTNDPDLAINLRSLMNHGRDSIYLSMDDSQNKSKEEMEMVIQRRFSFVQMGYSFRVTELEGALGLAAFEEREEMLIKRRENGDYFIEKLRPFAAHLQLPSIRDGAGHAFMMFPIVLRNETKAALVSHLEQNGIETRDMLPLTNQPFYQRTLGLKEDDYPIAKWINQNGFYIGSHHGLTDIEKEHVVEVFEAYFSQRPLQKQTSCLVVMSKGNAKAPILLYDALPIGSFDELVLVEASEGRETVEFYAKKGFKIIHEQGGKGDLLRKAVASISSENIVVLGLDGSDDPADVSSILIKLKQGNELVIASRFMSGGGRQTTRALSYRSIGNRFFSFLTSLIFSRNISDCNNSFRGFKKSAFKKLDLRQEDYNIMFEMTLMAMEKGLKFVECPTTERMGFPRTTKRNRFLSAISFCWMLAKYILNPSTQGKRRFKKADGA